MPARRRIRHMDPGAAPNGRPCPMPCRAEPTRPAGNGAANRPQPVPFCSAGLAAAAGIGHLASMLTAGAQGEFRRPAIRERARRSEGTGREPALRQGAFFVDLSRRHRKSRLARRGETRQSGADQPKPWPEPNSRDQDCLDPGLRRATRSCPECRVPLGEGTYAAALAEARRQCAWRAGRPAASRLSRRCTGPPGRVSCREPAGNRWSGRPGEAGAAAGERLSWRPFSSPQMVARRAGPVITASRSAQNRNGKDRRPWTPACARRRIVSGCRA